jgi:hypothetical protein
MDPHCSRDELLKPHTHTLVNQQVQLTDFEPLAQPLGPGLTLGAERGALWKLSEVSPLGEEGMVGWR